MRSKAVRNRHEIDDDEDDRPRARRPLWWRVLLRHPRDTMIGLVAAGAMTVIVVNSLFLQPGPHPAPIFKIKPLPVASSEATGAVALPRPRPAEAIRRETPQPVARSRAEIITDVQRELSRRGFYDGAVDGLYGARTDSAIRDFEQAAGLKPTGEPTEALVAAIQRASVKGKLTAGATAPRQDTRGDPIAGLIGPPNARQVMAVQRALSDFGYGQIKATGVYDGDTKASIERFERDRKLPVTGQISDRLMRELGGMTGRPLD